MERQIAEILQRITDIEERLDHAENELKSQSRAIGRDGAARAGIQTLAIALNQLVDATNIDADQKNQIKNDIEEWL